MSGHKKWSDIKHKKDDPSGMGGSPPNERDQAQDIIYEWRDKLGITSMNINEGIYVHPRVILAMHSELDEFDKSFKTALGVEEWPEDTPAIL